MAVGPLIGFLLVVLGIGVGVWGFKTVLDVLDLPAPIKQVGLVIVAVIAFIVLLVMTLRIFGIPVSL